MSNERKHDEMRVYALFTDRGQTVDGREKEELAALQLRLDSKIKVSHFSTCTMIGY